jgi:hypothetical protein
MKHLLAADTRFMGRNSILVAPTMLLLTLCVAPAARASDAVPRRPQPCDAQTLAAVGKSLGQPNFRPRSVDSGDSSVVAAACKALPSDKRILLVAVAYELPGQDSQDQKGLLVAMLDTDAGKLVRSYKTTIGEDALTQLGADSLWLDTAPYLLAPDQRAFGLVFTSIASAPRSVEGWGNDELVLFVPEADALQPIFQIVLSWWHENDDGSVISHTCTVGVGDRASQGRKDLVVNETIEVTAADGKASSQKRHHLARFDGSVYMPSAEWPSKDRFDSLLGTLGARDVSAQPR